MRQEIEAIHVEEAIEAYIVDIARATREYGDVEVGASPRGSLAIMKLAKSRAFVEGRTFVVPDDIKAVAVAALSHRLILGAEGWMRGKRTEVIIQEVLQSVPVPKVE
jgi:MoxR-like ATPase